MGYGATLAEPALNALGATVEELTVGTFRKKLLMQAVAIGVEVIEVLAGQMEIFADLYMVYLDDFKYPRELKDRVRASIIKAYRQPGWRLYLATIDGAPAAFAGLYCTRTDGSPKRPRPLSRR